MSQNVESSVFAHQFDAAIGFRGDGRLEDAVAGFCKAYASAATEHEKGIASLMAMTCYGELGQLDAAVEWGKLATGARPEAQSASVGLFLSLFKSGRVSAALEEAERLVSMRYSAEYDDMFSGMIEGLGEEQVLTVARIRRWLEMKRPSTE